MDVFAIAAADQPFQHPFPRRRAEKSIEHRLHGHSQGVRLADAGKHRQRLVNHRQLVDEEAARPVACERKGTDPAVGEAQRHGDVIGRTFLLEVDEDRIIETRVRRVQAAADGSGSLVDGRQRRSHVRLLQKNGMRWPKYLDRVGRPMPGKGDTDELRMQDPQAYPQSCHRHSGAVHRPAESGDQFDRFGDFPADS